MQTCCNWLHTPRTVVTVAAEAAAAVLVAGGRDGTKPMVSQGPARIKPLAKASVACVLDLCMLWAFLAPSNQKPAKGTCSRAH